MADADAETGPQPDTVLKEIQALQKQLQDTQHPEVGSLTLLGSMHAWPDGMALLVVMVVLLLSWPGGLWLHAAVWRSG